MEEISSENVNMSTKTTAKTGVVSVRLSSELKDRLDKLSAKTGRPAAYYVREALTDQIDELEYAYGLQAMAEEARRGELHTTSFEDVLTELGIAEDELNE